MSQPGPLDITHFAGDTLEKGFRINERLESAAGAVTYTPAVLTGWTPAATIRNARTRTAVAGVTAALGNQATDPGTVVVGLAAALTAGWSAGPSYIYDLQLTEDATGFIRTVASGRIYVVTT